MGMILQDPESSPETILASPRYSVVMSPIPDRAVGRIVKGRPRTADGLGEKSVGGVSPLPFALFLSFPFCELGVVLMDSAILAREDEEDE